MKKLLFITLSAALIAVACNKEIEPQEPQPISHGSQSFTAVREAVVDNTTRAFFNEDEKRLKWEVGDSIIISDGTAMSRFDLTEIDDEGTATFVIREGETELAENATYKAWYPVSFAPDADGKCNLAKQVKNANGAVEEGTEVNYAPSIYTENPMYAESTSHELSFKNACALIQFTIELPEGADDTAFSQIIVESESSQVYGPGTIVDNTFVPAAETASDYGRSAVVNSNSKWQSVVKKYYLALPAQTYESLTFIPVTNKKLVQYFPINKPLTLERNIMYTLTLTCNDLRTDLSQNHTSANCYNVKQGSGACMFKATKGIDSEPVEGIDHAKVLWRSQAGTAKDLTGKIISDVTYSKGYIKFTSANNQGNAVIAACDAEDNILWSWHIWSTKSLVGTQTLNGKTVLDRNLGGYYDNYYEGGDLTDGTGKYYNSIFCAGLLYQWGRKDPFSGRCDQTSASTTTMPHGTEGVETTISTSGAVSVATAVANPTVYYASSTGIWASETVSWDGDEKSAYDPCPYGYRVCDNTIWGTPVTENFSTVYQKANAKGTEAIMGYTYTDGTSTTFYPTTGQLNNKTGAFGSGMAQSRIWHRTVTDGKAGFYNLTHNSDKSIKAAQVTANLDVNSAYGMAVRCQKIEE